ncbi:MAG: type II toxin-antitoxin system RelE/ParE family toxin [Armatimonadota bacterium]
MRVRILSPAERELLDAIEYYNAERPGLGIEFAREIRLTLNRIKAHPYAWTKIDPTFRRCPTDRFPYSAIYQIVPQEIIVVAFMHHKRHPEYWRNRITRK